MEMYSGDRKATMRCRCALYSRYLTKEHIRGREAMSVVFKRYIQPGSEHQRDARLSPNKEIPTKLHFFPNTKLSHFIKTEFLIMREEGVPCVIISKYEDIRTQDNLICIAIVT